MLWVILLIPYVYYCQIYLYLLMIQIWYLRKTILVVEIGWWEVIRRWWKWEGDYVDRLTHLNNFMSLLLILLTLFGRDSCKLSSWDVTDCLWSYTIWCLWQRECGCKMTDSYDSYWNVWYFLWISLVVPGIGDRQRLCNRNRCRIWIVLLFANFLLIWGDCRYVVIDVGNDRLCHKRVIWHQIHIFLKHSISCMLFEGKSNSGNNDWNWYSLFFWDHLIDVLKLG